MMARCCLVYSDVPFMSGNTPLTMLNGASCLSLLRKSAPYLTSQKLFTNSLALTYIDYSCISECGCVRSACADMPACWVEVKREISHVLTDIVLAACLETFMRLFLRPPSSIVC